MHLDSLLILLNPFFLMLLLGKIYLNYYQNEDEDKVKDEIEIKKQLLNIINKSYNNINKFIEFYFINYLNENSLLARSISDINKKDLEQL